MYRIWLKKYEIYTVRRIWTLESFKLFLFFKRFERYWKRARWYVDTSIVYAI